MMIYVNLEKKLLTVGDKNIPISCVVRNELNGWRPMKNTKDVFTTLPDQEPSMPRTFPKGVWNVYKPLPRTNPYLAPFYIPTDAYQELEVWELDSKGYYVRGTGRKVKDIAYGLHFSTSNTTQGCIKILNLEDLMYLVNKLSYPCKITVS
jgi:hypothetical protein